MYSFLGQLWEERVQMLFTEDFDDGNGKVSVSELEKFMVKLYRFPFSDNEAKTRLISKIINIINEFYADADGKVDFEIFKRVYAYKHLDKWGTGRLDLDSFLETVRRRRWTDEMITYWFRKYGEVKPSGIPKFTIGVRKFFINPVRIYSKNKNNNSCLVSI